LNAVIEFRDVWRGFGAQSVLRGLNLEVREGEVFALVGRNGAGKTTALRLLLGLIESDFGQAYVFGTPSMELSGAQRDSIGYLSEGHQIEPLRTIRRTLDYERCTRTSFDYAFAHDRIERLGLRLGTKVKHLSRGQRAQLGLVLALAGHPRLLVFDDPALGLDVVMRRELFETMIDLLASEGTTVLFSTHAFADVERLANRVGILHDGALIVDAELDDLRARVQKRFLWTDATNELGDLPGVLSFKPEPDGADVLILDYDLELERSLAERGVRASEPRTPNLEDLFVDLTSGGGVQ